MTISLYREWLCDGCGNVWPWKKGQRRPPHCPTCEPEKGRLPNRYTYTVYVGGDAKSVPLGEVAGEKP